MNDKEKSKDYKELKDYVVLTKEEYEELVKYKIKAKQYKNFILDNTNNNNLVKAMITIEGKNLYKLIDENKEEN